MVAANNTLGPKKMLLGKKVQGLRPAGLSLRAGRPILWLTCMKGSGVFLLTQGVST
jgi:hypothetical protein